MADIEQQSFPANEAPLSSDQWASVTRGIGSGVLDEGGAPYRLTNINNAANTVTVNVDSGKKFAHAILGGFYHKITKSATLTIPAVTSATTFYVALQLDPARAAEGGLPVKLDVFTSLDRTQNKDYLILHRIERQQNQLLTDAAFTKMDVKIAPQIMVDTFESLPPAETVLWGTTAIVRLPREVSYQSRGTTGGARSWERLYERGWEALPDTTNGAYAGEGLRKQIKRDGFSRKVVGAVARSDGSLYSAQSSAGYHIASLTGQDRPAARQTFPVVFSGADSSVKAGYIEASRTNSELRLHMSQGQATFAMIPTIEYIAEVEART